MVVRRSGRPPCVWDLNKLDNRIVEMREQYAEWKRSATNSQVTRKQIKVTFSGGFRGSGRGGVWTFFFLSGIRFPHQPKGSPLVLLYDIHYRPTNSKNFLKVHMAPIYNNFEGGAHQKKTLFSSSKLSTKKKIKNEP